MLNKIMILTTIICTAASLFISEPAHAQISELKITASDGATFDLFGESVSISGDYAVVGAGDHDSTGSAYVFKRSGTSWVEEAKLFASDGEAGDIFGGSVSIFGDYAVVGAFDDDDNGDVSGSAYVFKRTDTSWAQEAKLLPSDGEAGDMFGNSVSISGDYALVGAVYDGDNGPFAGSAYLFKRTDTTWTQEAKLFPSDGAAEQHFGWSVFISGDYAVVGAICVSDNGNCSGAAYVFKRSDTSWVEEAKLFASDGAAGDLFGNSVSISGDYAVVGSFLDDDNGDRSGSAYVFKRSGVIWEEEAKLLPSDGAEGDEFGNSVSVSGNYAVVGAHGDDDNGEYSGSAHVFKRVGISWVEKAKLLPSDGAAFDEFGWPVSISGDYTVVGARFNDDNGFSSGSAYLYTGFTSAVDMGVVSVSPRFVAPGIDSVVVTAVVAKPSDLNISIFAEIETPDQVPLDTLTLFDDGAHNDGEAGDSLFGNAWAIPLDEERIYFVDLHASYVDTDTVTVNIVLDNAGLFTNIGPVILDSHILLEDTIPNPGDNIFFDLSLRNNSPTATATAVTADISTADTCVSIIFQADNTFGDIPAGQSSATMGINFGVGIIESCPDNHAININISISSEGLKFWSDSFSLQLIPVGVTDEEIIIPVEYSLAQNYPNPFNPVTLIGYALPKASDISLVIYNLRGQEVRRWDIQGQHAGNHKVIWDASSAASGVYLYRLKAGDFVQTKKMLLLK